MPVGKRAEFVSHPWRSMVAQIVGRSLVFSVGGCRWSASPGVHRMTGRSPQEGGALCTAPRQTHYLVVLARPDP